MMSDNILGAIINAIVVIVAVYLAFQFNKKTNVHARKLGWNETQADDFLKCSRGFNQTVSRIVVDIVTRDDLIKWRKGDWKKDSASMEETIKGHINAFRLLDWELKRYADSAHKTKGDFLAKEKDLFDITSQFIGHCINPTGHPFSLELIREKQNLFDKLAKDVHAELCGI